MYMLAYTYTLVLFLHIQKHCIYSISRWEYKAVYTVKFLSCLTLYNTVRDE